MAAAPFYYDGKSDADRTDRNLERVFVDRAAECIPALDNDNLNGFGAQPRLLGLMILARSWKSDSKTNGR